MYSIALLLWLLATLALGLWLIAFTPAVAIAVVVVVPCCLVAVGLKASLPCVDAGRSSHAGNCYRRKTHCCDDDAKT